MLSASSLKRCSATRNTAVKNMLKSNGDDIHHWHSSPAPSETTPSMCDHRSARKLLSQRGNGGLLPSSEEALQSERVRSIESCAFFRSMKFRNSDTLAFFPKLVRSAHRRHHLMSMVERHVQIHTAHLAAVSRPRSRYRVSPQRS